MLKKYLGDRPFWRTTLRLGIPVALQNLLASSFSLIDTLMVSSLGDRELSATGMAAQWSTLMMFIAIGLGAAVSIFVAQYWGAKDVKGINRAVGMCIPGGIIGLAIFLIPAFLWPEFVIKLFNKDLSVIDIGCTYLRIACWSYPATLLTMIVSSLLRSLEKPKVPMYASAVAAALNGLLNYCLIFGKLGLPAMGVSGAALATVISAWTAPVLMFIIMFVDKHKPVHFTTRDMLHFSGRDLGAFYRKAAPVIINNIGWSGGVFALNMIYSNISYESFAAVTILRNVGDLIFAFYLGFGNASIVQVGKKVGAGHIREAKSDALRYKTLVTLSSVILGLGMTLLRGPIVSLYNTRGQLSQVTVSAAVAIMAYYGIAQPVRNIAYIQIDGIIRAGGDATFGAVVDTASMWVVAIPVAYVVAYVFRVPFVATFMIASLAEDIPKAAACIWYFATDKWIRPVTAKGAEGLEKYLSEKNPEG